MKDKIRGSLFGGAIGDALGYPVEFMRSSEIFKRCGENGICDYQREEGQSLIASVNHGGDSDSTGAVAGNIMGAVCGYDGIAEKWKDRLELKDVILEIADDLASGCTMSEFDDHTDEKWVHKYIICDYSPEKG